MPLIVSDVLQRASTSYVSLSSYYVTVSPYRFTEPYGINTSSPVEVKSELIEISPLETRPELNAFKEIKGIEGSLFLIKGRIGSMDLLYLSIELWAKIRDSGFVGMAYNFTFKLKKFVINGKEIDIYPLRDLR